MPKGDELGTGLELKQIYPPPGAPAQAAVQNVAQVPNGLVMVPGGAGSIFVLPPQPAPQPAASQPPVVVLMVSSKDEKKEEKKEVSSVFQRL